MQFSGQRGREKVPPLALADANRANSRRRGQEHGTLDLQILKGIPLPGARDQRAHLRTTPQAITAISTMLKTARHQLRLAGFIPTRAF